MSIEPLITEHLEIWTSAHTEKPSGRGRSAGSADGVYGIKKLRALILELAVRGKLVPQDPNDEPASELVKRTNTSKLKTIKLQQEINDQEKPFALPNGWEWVNFGAVSEIERGGSPRPIKSFITTEEEGLNWIKIGDTDQGGKYITSTIEKIRKEGLSKTRMVYPGDFLLTNSMSFGRPYITKIVGCIHDGWLRISPPEALDKDFLYNLLSSPYVRNVFIAAAAGAVVMNLNADKVRNLLIPVPPLAEQHRIVAKVDELMALCDQLEAQHHNATDAHEKLVKHLLGTLTQAHCAEDFNSRWQCISAHFHTLFTTEASVDALKQTLLQLAVMGKLVAQDPNDEPASELVKRIQAEKARLVAEGKIKKVKPLAEISEAEKPFGLPLGWEWVRLGEITNFGITEKLSFISDQTWVLDLEDIEKDTSRLLNKHRFCERRSLSNKNSFNEGDVLYGKLRPYLNKVIVADESGVCTTEILPIRCYSSFSSHYFKCVLKSSYFITYVNAKSYGMKMPRLGTEDGRKAHFPLPPLAEQHRIVAKVDEIMVICDKLKSQITSANQLQQKLADIVIEQATS